MSRPIPLGVEVLVRKAAVDPEFRATLLARRAEAAAEIDLELEPAEAAMLAAAPAEQLEAIIDRTTVPQAHRRAFLGKAAAAMLAALGASAVAGSLVASAGVRVDWPSKRPERTPAPEGIAPDMPPERPEHEPAPAGERPDMPPERPSASEYPPRGAEENRFRETTLGIRPGEDW
jgi:hypothetical protein